jgi:hypothetical protein
MGSWRLRTSGLRYLVGAALLGCLTLACGSDERPAELEEIAPGEGVWEISPVETDRLPLGRLALLQGSLSAEGERFALRNLDIRQPIQITVVSREEADPLHLEAFKTSWDQPLASIPSDDGVSTLRFRTADAVYLRIAGREGIEYQLAAWVGPVVETPELPAFTRAGAGGGGGCGGGLLLALLLVGGGAFWLRRRHQRGAGGGALLLAVAASLVASGGLDAAADTPRGVREEWERTSRAMNELRERLGNLPSTGNQQIDDVVGATQLMISFMEQFGFIDPREAAVQPDYSPEGAPPLPSSCYDDPTGRCNECFSAATTDFDKWRKLLEDQWVIYRQVELEAGRILELADAAAGLHPAAKLAWAVQKTDPGAAHVKAQQQFYADYDKNYTELIRRLNDGLLAIGKCEEEHHGDRDWYNRFGLPYYLFMRDRYQRR